MNGICSAELGSRYATRFPFDVVEPALKRGAKLDCRYRGRATLVTGKALDWKRGPTLDCRYRGKATLVTGKALDWKRGAKLDCRYRGKATLVTGKALDWKRGPTLDCRYRGKGGSGASDLGRIGSGRAGRMFGFRTDG